ncbi:MAG: hypothetical protein K2Z81_09655 [Cyanobacteria bacterium]|nr:hypothetical protein [Cyanobacteriota bacterium]
MVLLIKEGEVVLLEIDLSEQSFNQWVVSVFDHPESHQEWYLDASVIEPPPKICVQYVTNAFENAKTILGRFSDKQIRDGLQFLLSNSFSNHVQSIYNNSVEYKDKRRCVRSFLKLFEDVFYPRCSPHLLHLDEAASSPLNEVCYMWWDTYPGCGQPKDSILRELDFEILEVIKATLELNSLALRESALHGLGHWQIYYPQMVQIIVDKFLADNMALRPQLRQYALDARIGLVN